MKARTTARPLLTERALRRLQRELLTLAIANPALTQAIVNIVHVAHRHHVPGANAHDRPEAGS